MRIYHASCTGVFHWDQRKQITRNGWERAHGPPTVIAVREGRGELRLSSGREDGRSLTSVAGVTATESQEKGTVGERTAQAKTRRCV